MKNFEDRKMPEASFTYQLLGRLQQDCEYYLGAGNRNKKYLWALDEQAQIDKMRELYDQLPEKPEWLTLHQIDRYSTQMLRDPKNDRKLPQRNLVVDGLDESGNFAGDGEKAPFVVFDADDQQNIAGPFVTRAEGEKARTEILVGATPVLNSQVLDRYLQARDEGQKPDVSMLVGSRKMPEVKLTSRALAEQYPVKGSMPFAVAEQLYELREAELESLGQRAVIQVDDLRDLDRLGRFMVADGLFEKCNDAARHSLLHDDHPHVRSCAEISKRELDELALLKVD
ncbi:LPD11 domain-containing protein [Ralstonia pseudosolanacearum]|uniref:LPD11 domain-containing protein n=1 Tax=Ralstonia pseudosolanacearum TaxID=1310165 RepID=UPI003CF69058